MGATTLDVVVGAMTTLVGCSPSMRRLVLGIALLLSIDASLTAWSYSPPAPRASVAASTEVLFEKKGYVRNGREENSHVEQGPLVAAAEGRERWCRLEELLPALQDNGDDERSSEWSDENVVDAPFGCDCATYKSRYFCPNLGSDGYPKWEPHAVLQGTCKSVTRTEISEDGPFPPNFRVLFYGNSHMRQVVESLMCHFESKIAVKRMSVYSLLSSEHDGEAGMFYDALLPGDSPCRACFDTTAPYEVTEFQQEMLDHHCIPDVEACKCYDDEGEYYFDNGATAHFYFAGSDEDKSVRHALEFHGGVPLSYYDVVFANNGNGPTMSSSSMLEVADEVQAAGGQFVWLSTYSGDGDIGNNEFMDDKQRARFRESGARYLGINRMTSGLRHLTKGEVEDDARHDGHFCLPGPPSEMGLLVLKLAWAIHHERQRE